MPATATTERIVFELDRFELGEPDRLELTGRWYGIRGRRFVRPSLTMMADGENARALADLEHKPWAAEDGEEWHAAFHCTAEKVAEAQLSVAPDIIVRLPAPGSNGSSPQRLEVIPPPAKPTRRRRSTSRARKAPGTASSSQVADSAPAPTPELPAPPERASSRSPELDQARQVVSDLRDELQQLRSELELAVVERDEIKTAFARRDAVVKELRAALSQRLEAEQERARTEQEREQGLAEREAGLTKREAALQAHDAALVDRNRVLDERETALSQQGTSLSRRQAELDGREHQLIERDRSLARREADLQERESAVAERPLASRGIELRPASAPARRARNATIVWLQRAFAVVFLLAPILAVAVLTKAI